MSYGKTGIHENTVAGFCKNFRLTAEIQNILMSFKDSRGLHSNKDKCI